MPDNSLRIVGFYLDAGYQVEDVSAAVRAKSNGNSIINSAYVPLFIEYLTITTDNDKLPPLVRKCLVYLLASKIATAQGKDDTKIMQKYENNPEALRDAGIAYAIDQIIDLAANDVDGVHIYTMNNSYVSKRIYDGVQSIMGK